MDGNFQNGPTGSPNPQPIDTSHWIFDPFGDDKEEDDEDIKKTARQKALDSITKGFNKK